MKVKYGGIKCAECGNNRQLALHVGWTGMDCDCKAGEGSGYGWVVSLFCPDCGRIYPICMTKDNRDVSEYVG